MEKNVKKKGRLKMALFTFSGGVHPADGKEFAKNSPITEYLPKGDVVLPLGQHIGAPAQPIVSKGDQVLVGQKVAEAGGFVSANIFSSVSGTVKAIEPRMTPAGAKVNSIVIENDGEFKEAAFEAKPYDQMAKILINTLVTRLIGICNNSYNLNSFPFKIASISTQKQ